MLRRANARLIITGKLVALAPLHVGGVGGNADVDMALAVNGSGNLYVPGTSIAGPLRAWLRARAGEERVKRLWGFQEPPPRDAEEARKRRDAREDDLGRASSVFVEDGVVELPKDASIEIRDGVGINRVTGAAADAVKYDRAVLPIGSRIKFEMTVELPANEAAANDARAMTGAVLKALQDCEIRFGAACSRGLGRVRLEELRIRAQSFSTSKALLETLRGQDQPLELGQLGDCAFATQPGLNVTIAWKPRGPLMVKAERDGIAVDMLPLVSAIDGQLAFVLPGSSIKGALRSHAERIVRTVRERNAPSDGNTKQLFLRQIEILESPDDEEDEEKRRSLIGALFGAPGRQNKQGDPDDREKLPPLLGASAITIEDCYARNHFSFAQWSRIERAGEISPANEEGSLLAALEAAGLQSVQPAHHVAIDRWTGGAADGFLYTVLEPHGIEWNEIELLLDLTRVRKEEWKAAIACLLLTLRDLVAGRISLGFGVNHGMGAVQVIGLEIKPQGIENDDVLNQLREIKVDAQKLIWPSQELRRKLNDAWTRWIAR